MPLLGSKGIRVNNIGKSGQIVENSVLSYNNNSNLQLEIDQWQPILTVMSWGANDYLKHTPLATFKLAVQKLIKEAKKYGDVIIMPLCLESDNPAPYNSITQADYANALKQLAMSNDCYYIDIYDAWGGNIYYAYNKGFESPLGNVHPAALGHQNIANYLIQALNMANSNK